MANQRTEEQSSKVGKIIFAVVTLSVVFLGVKIYKSLQLSPAPVLDEPWWGPGKTGQDNTAIKPFKINVPEEVLIDLKNRLNQKRTFTTPLEDVQHHYGLNTQLLEEIITFWKTKYDWRQREKYLNKYPQFKTQIQGLDIHFLHVKPAETKGLKVLPLLLLHGWPGSVREFYEIIPMLTTPQKGRDFVFEVIAPSLPGYGFSQAASKRGLGAAQMGVVFKNLMERLSFKKYYLQGGDWGAIIIATMSQLFEDRILGMHSTMCFSQAPASNMKLLLGSLYPPAVVEKDLEDKLYPLSKFISNLFLEFGYMHLQATKPDTVGVALNDSPVGLAAYIFEKFITWTNPQWKSLPDGGLKTKFKYEDILDNIMIYWVTNSITTSMRLYAETFSKEYRKLGFDNVGVNVPAACGKFKHELAAQPDNFLRDIFSKLVQSTSFKDGGHFAAFEVPKLLADDIWSAVEKMQKMNK